MLCLCINAGFKCYSTPTLPILISSLCHGYVLMPVIVLLCTKTATFKYYPQAIVIYKGLFKCLTLKLSIVLLASCYSSVSTPGPNIILAYVMLKRSVAFISL